MTDDERSARELERLIFQIDRGNEDRERKRRAALKDARGKLRPVFPANLSIRTDALTVEPIRGDRRGAEIWICYTPGRAEWLLLREDPKLREELKQTVSLCDPDALNGYVAFNKRHAPRLPGGTGNIVQYIPVHGGITWAAKDRIAAVWGFDTMHYRSEAQPRTDPDWIRANCLILYRGLLAAEQLWPEFRRASTERRAELAQRLLDLIPEQPIPESLGITGLLNLLSGKIG